MTKLSTKRCFICKKIKSIDDFYHHPKTKDKTINKCKNCCAKQGKIRRDNPLFRERILEDIRQRMRMRRKNKVIRNKEREKYRIKNRARQSVYKNRIKNKIIRGCCDVCKTDKNIEGHHTDYNKPLEVTWLCRKHHKEIHRKYKF